MQILRLFIIILIGSSFRLNAQTLKAHYAFNSNYLDSSSSGNHLSEINLTDNKIDIYSKLGHSGVAGDSAVSFWASKSLKSNQTNNIGWSGTAVSFWIKEAYSGQLLQAAYIGFGIDMGYGNDKSTIRCFFDGGSAGQITTSSLAVNFENSTWHHVVCQNDGTTTSIYIDGSLDTSHSESLFTMSTANINARYYIGNNLDGNRAAQLYLDELKIFNDALSSTQISNLYNNELTTHSQGLSENTKVEVFPTLTSNQVTINSIHTIQSLQLFNVHGHQVKSFQVNKNNLDLSNLTNGIYFLRIKINDKLIIKKILKQ